MLLHLSNHGGVIPDLLQHQLVQMSRRLHGRRLLADCAAHLCAADVSPDALSRGTRATDDAGDAGEHVAQRPHT